jgi:hypothetical protein
MLGISRQRKHLLGGDKMKKFAICAVLVLGIMAFTGAATPAHATKCIHLTNFCDSIQVNIDSYGNAYGNWGWLCDGVTLANILGRKGPIHIQNLATRPVFSSGFAYYYTFQFDFNQPGAGYFNMYATDGNTSFPQQLDQPFDTTNGSCSFAANKGKRSSVGVTR